MSDLATLVLMALTVAIAAVAGIIIGRMVARRIDRWEQARPDPAAEEPGDHTDPG